MTVHTVREVASQLRVSEATVLRMLARGELGGVRAGSAWRIPATALDAYLEGWRDGLQYGCEPRGQATAEAAPFSAPLTPLLSTI